MKNCKRNRLRAWTFRPAQPPLPPSPTLTVVLRAKFWGMGKIAGQLSRFLYRSVSSVTVCDFKFLHHFCRFPIILRRFHLNPGTGGNGFHRGGDGVVRELLFRRSQVLSVLGERRAFRPYGLNGMRH